MGSQRASSRSGTSAMRARVSHVCEALGVIAPLHLAQSWDNVGLLAGDPSRPVKSVMLCIDLTPDVAAEAAQKKAAMVMAYHPPIFKSITRITAASGGAEQAVFRCVENGIAVYSTHTALDAAAGGTNDVLAQMCGIRQSDPVEYIDAGQTECKIVVFVPGDEVDAVADAMFRAGAGRIGDYQKCSYRLDGVGTFLGSDTTHPTVGCTGTFERVPETRLEMVCPKCRLAAVLDALVAAHSYEEPAFDVYPLTARPVRGIGRVGQLPRPITLAGLARKLARCCSRRCVQAVGPLDRTVRRAVIVVGAAGSLPFQLALTPDDVIITGEMRHHDALTVLRRGCSAIALGHWTSERPVLAAVGARLTELLPNVRVVISQQDREPFAVV